jgi:hypothetical protein
MFSLRRSGMMLAGHRQRTFELKITCIRQVGDASVILKSTGAVRLHRDNRDA